MVEAAHRVLLVEDDRFVGPVLQRALEGTAAVMLVTSLGEARRALAHARRDLVILDEQLGDGSGIALAEQLRRESRPPRITLITAFGSPDLLTRARLANVDYLEKLSGRNAEESFVRVLQKDIERALIEAESIDEHYHRTATRLADERALTEAERDVLCQIAALIPLEEIAERREVSARTVSNQLQSIYDKLAGC